MPTIPVARAASIRGTSAGDRHAMTSIRLEPRLVAEVGYTHTILVDGYALRCFGGLPRTSNQTGPRRDLSSPVAVPATCAARSADRARHRSPGSGPPPSAD